MKTAAESKKCRIHQGDMQCPLLNKVPGKTRIPAIPIAENEIP
jgi:hypothetical protein